jgi:hypothetical protein
MEFTPFTLTEATEVWDDFSDLPDTELRFGSKGNLLVDRLVICPFGKEDKEQFIAIFKDSKDPVEALKNYKGDEFDVLIIASDDYFKDYFIDIRLYALEKGVTYNFPG